MMHIYASLSTSCIKCKYVYTLFTAEMLLFLHQKFWEHFSSAQTLQQSVIPLPIYCIFIQHLHHRMPYIVREETMHVSNVINRIICQLSPCLYYVYSDTCRQNALFCHRMVGGDFALWHWNKWIQAGLSHQIHLLIIACSEIDMRPAHCEVRIQCQRQLYGMASTIIRI